jgi:maleylacetate reductase
MEDEKPRSQVFVQQAVREPKVVSGPGTLSQIGSEILSLGCVRPVILTSPSVYSRTPLVSEVLGQIGIKGETVFSDVRPHTYLDDVFAALTHVARCEADCIVSIGGGSVIDLCKAVAFASAHNITCEAELANHLTQYSGQAVEQSENPNSILKHIAIPITGSAAEFTGIVGVTSAQESRKFLIVAPYVVPNTVVLDPTATLHTPQRLLLSTFVRSLDHAVEALYGPTTTAYTDLLAAAALERILTGLAGCKSDPKELSARSSLQIGAWFGVNAGIRAGTGLSHGLGYILGGSYHVPHGICSCVTLSHILDWNIEYARSSISKVAMALGQIAEPERAGSELRRLLQELGLPCRLSEIDGVERSDFEDIAKLLVKMPHAKTNPRPLNTQEEAVELLNLAW